ncbi:hypothetical protein HZB60_00825 [candidate division KSB1 bacterium]|nr:hypothetical protein [candidate division KSB1 bacterium]
MPNPVIIPAAKGAQLKKVHFPSFERKPANYFKDIITDEAVGAPADVPPQELHAAISSEVERERRIMRVAAKRDAEQQFNAGVAEGRNHAAAEISAAVELLKQYAQVLLAERGELRKAAEKHAVELAVEIAREVIGTELSIRPPAVAEAVEHALRNAADASAVTLRVSKEDVALLDDAAKKWIGAAGLPAQIELRADATLSRGDCYIDSAAGTVDARIESQLLHLRDGLLRGIKP